MAGHTGFPTWLLDSKSRITKTKEWTEFIENLSDAVQQQLTESHIQSFTDLTDAERTLLIDKAAKTVHGGDAYMQLYGQVSKVLDQHLNNQVAKEMLEDFPIATKSDLILEGAQEGAINLLRRWPDMKSKLHVNFNQPLAPRLRQFVWKLALDNSKVRQLYLELLKIDPRKAISPQDLEISKRCEQLIVSEPTLEPFKGSIGAFYGMKAVLSYHHALKRSRNSLPKQDLLLMVPFVEVAHPSMSRREPASPKVVTLLVEEYLSFMHSRPGFLFQDGEETMRSVAKKVTEILKEKCPDLVKKISAIYETPNDKLVETEFTNEALLVDAVQLLTGPVVSSMFVTYLPLETVVFLWDQYMLGMGSPGFHEEFVPTVAAVFIILLKDKLEGCDSMENMEKTLKDEGAKLKPRQFQFEIKSQYYDDLYEKLTQGGKSALPVLDPTQIQFPFYHWHSERIPERTEPSDRRQAREERDMERQRQLEAVRQQQIRDRQKDEREKREDFDKYLQQAADDRKRTEDDRMYLEKLLEEERKRRFDEEKNSAKEIDKLKEELENMKRRYGSRMSGHSAISRFLIPPPNTPSVPATHPPQPPVVQPTPPGRPTPAPGTRPPTTDRPNSTVQKTVTDLLARVAQGLDLITHGEGSEKSDLDDETRRNLLDHREDLKQAEIEVFGRVMEEHDYSRMSDSERETARRRVTELVKKRIHERHERTV